MSLKNDLGYLIYNIHSHWRFWWKNEPKINFFVK